MLAVQTFIIIDHTRLAAIYKFVLGGREVGVDGSDPDESKWNKVDLGCDKNITIRTEPLDS